MNIVESPYLIISVIGSHAGESLVEIFLRKQLEIEKTGNTYWLVQSHKAKTQHVQDLCRKAKQEEIPVYCLLIEPSQKSGASPTIHNAIAEFVSSNNKDWGNIPNGIRVTGKISKNSTALVFDKLEVLDAPITLDLWEYSEFKTKNPIKLMLGASTVCCERAPSQGMKNRYRNIVGIGRLASPYGLWLK